MWLTVFHLASNTFSGAAASNIFFSNCHHHATSLMHLAGWATALNGVLSLKPPTSCIMPSSLNMVTPDKLLAHALTLFCLFLLTLKSLAYSSALSFNCGWERIKVQASMYNHHHAYKVHIACQQALSAGAVCVVCVCVCVSASAKTTLLLSTVCRLHTAHTHPPTHTHTHTHTHKHVHTHTQTNTCTHTHWHTQLCWTQRTDTPAPADTLYKPDTLGHTGHSTPPQKKHTENRLDWI